VYRNNIKSLAYARLYLAEREGFEPSAQHKLCNGFRELLPSPQNVVISMFHNYSFGIIDAIFAIISIIFFAIK